MFGSVRWGGRPKGQGGVKGSGVVSELGGTGAGQGTVGRGGQLDQTESAGAGTAAVAAVAAAAQRHTNSPLAWS